jgi:hypothetical protein
VRGLAAARLNPTQTWPQEEEFCDEFHLVDLRVYENCKKVRFATVCYKERKENIEGQA